MYNEVHTIILDFINKQYKKDEEQGILSIWR